MPENQVTVEAVYRQQVDVASCVLALLALAQQMQPATGTEPEDD